MIIEQKVIEYLVGDDYPDATVPIYAETPIAPPLEYYIVQLTSADETDFVRSATVAIQSVSEISLWNAAQMCEWIIEAMRAFDTVENVFSCDLNSAYNWTDTDTKQYRYQAVFDISYQDDLLL